jgi:hypothetical protein
MLLTAVSDSLIILANMSYHQYRAVPLLRSSASVPVILLFIVTAQVLT